MNDRSLSLSLKNRTKSVLNVAGSRTFASSVLLSILVLILLSFPSNMVGQSPPPKWKQGDVFLGVGGGTWKVYRPSINAIVDTMSDGVTSPGANNGSALDNTWHLIGTDSGSSSNLSKIVRFRISPHDPNNSTAVSDVLSVINGSTGTNSKNPQSVTVASNGNIILANASPATIAIFGPSGSFISSFPLANRFIDKALASTDLSSDGSVLFYTSGGANIEKLQLSGAGAGTITNFATLTGQKLFGIKVVPICSPGLSPGCPSGSGILVAAQSTVFLLDGTSGAIVKQYAITGQNNLKVLSLDPLVQDTSGNKQVSDFFWVGSPTSANFYRVSFSTGVASSPLASGASGVFSLATYASFSANQPIPTVFPQATVGSSPPTSAVYVYTDNHPNSTNFDQLTLTGYGTAFTTTVSVFASSVQPASGFSDDGLPCTPTVDGLCTIWEIDADPPLPSGALMGMKIFSTGTAAPPDALLKQTLVLRN